MLRPGLLRPQDQFLWQGRVPCECDACTLSNSGVRRNFRKRVRQQRISVISLHTWLMAIMLCTTVRNMQQKV
jgi:hypothetical protein